MQISEIFFNADMIDVISELQSELHQNHINLLSTIKDTPDNVMVSCPYHKGGQEHRPSAGIKKTDGTFHCFACGETHSLQEVISHCFGHTEDVLGSFGWNWLMKNFLIISVENRKDIELDFGRVRKAQTKSYVSELELDSYRNYHPYMWKRKMTPDVVEVFDVGFDKKTSCITFPVRDIDGNTLFIARRSVNTKFFNYPAGAEKPVYGLYEYLMASNGRLKNVGIDFSSWDSQSIIICESMIDAITCWTYGKYAVALNGLGNELQFEQLNMIPCRKYIIATDADEAGMRARKRIQRRIHNRIITQYVWDVNKAKDINDMSKEYFDNLQEIF